MDVTLHKPLGPTVPSTILPACMLFIAAICARAAPAEASEGGHVLLRVGYQPYFAPAWSGAIIRAAHLDSTYLPAGVEVVYTIGLQGAGVLVNSLRHDELDLAYLGITPALTVTQEAGGDAFRIIAVTSVSADLCNVIVARAGAPDRPSRTDALRWLNKKRVGTIRGTCSDLYLSDLIDQNDVHPARLLDLTPDLLKASMIDGQIDAAAVWEPYATDLARLVNGSLLISGQSTDQPSPTFLVARTSLIAQRPAVVRGWIDAERAAQKILALQADRRRTLELLESQTRGLDPATLQEVLTDSGADATYPLAVIPRVRALLEQAAGRMARRRLLRQAALRKDTIDDRFAREAIGNAASKGGLAVP